MELMRADADRQGGEPVVIVSQSLAQRMFPNQDAVNRHMTWTDPLMKVVGVSPAPRRIVGIAADVTLQRNIQRLKLDVAQHVPIYGQPGPGDRFAQIAARQTN
jgi:hypothetical protein